MTLEAISVSSEELDAKTFLELAEQHPEQIKRVSIVPGHLGSRSIGGRLRVEYALPFSKVLNK
ncbi:hypothetical protein DBB33_12485 [Chromobacterium haemolyticum]|uniref:Uncharacterized protein n=1 Tax=Chromobacterium rhizoryzae TaxID=1778675 RepID=A0AAD0RXA4_9NEIS|nr:hypothetical protein D1345_09100 [Chromobacterium rhizoryzae]OQS40410.1 hypothetical protein B0T40_01170 [Chromobacterium haemolyticum]PTU70203.1 hypothetical protein DBB33_12485 [Chromobacterium haemolyticum]